MEITRRSSDRRDRDARPCGFGDDFVEIDSLNLRLDSTISNKFVNEFRFQWSRRVELAIRSATTTGPANHG